MNTVVTGLSQSGNIKALETALHAAGLSLDHIQVIGPDDSDVHLASGVIRTGLMDGGTGVHVPGINGEGRGTGFFRNENLSDRLGDFRIPDSEVENYIEALQNGRTVIAYYAKPDTCARVEEIFRASDLLKVKTF